MIAAGSVRTLEAGPSSGPAPLVRRLCRPFLTSRALPFALAALTAFLTLPAVNVGWAADDFFLRRRILQAPGLSGLPAVTRNLFVHLDGNPDHMLQLMDSRGFPWWTLPDVAVAFWRPLASATHWLDHVLWPDSSVLMHVQNIAWLAGVVVLVTVYYRRVMGATLVAGLAALLFAIDDAHGGPVGWIANRNALMAAFFAVAALIVHDRWRAESWRPGAVLAPLLLLIGLLSSEGALAACAYLAARAAFVETDPWRRRVSALIPYGVVAVGWRVLYNSLGFGAWGSGMYVDLGREPARFAAEAVHWLPALWIGQWTYRPSEQYLSKSYAGVETMMALGFGLMLLMAVLFAPLLRRERIARFWAAGMMLTFVPACSTFPMDRLLLLAGFGAAPLLALFLAEVFGSRGRHQALAWRIPAFALAAFFVLVHLVWAPFWLAVRSGTAKRELLPELERMALSLPDDPAATSQTFVLLQGDFTVGVYFPDVLALQGRSGPAHWRVLGPESPMKIERSGDRTLIVRPVDGFLPEPDTGSARTNLARRLDYFLRAAEWPPPPGYRLSLPGMSAEVSAVGSGGRPSEATFRFDVSLDDPSLRWFRLSKGQYVAFTPPLAGATLDVGLE